MLCGRSWQQNEALCAFVPWTLYPDPMPVTVDQVWQTGLTFPNVEKSTTFGKPALKVRGNLMAAVPSISQRNSVAIRNMLSTSRLSEFFLEIKILF